MSKIIIFRKNIILKFFFILFFIFSNNVFSSDLIKKKYSLSETNNIENNSFLKSHYILGSGDILFIEFIGIKLYSKQYIIDPDGYLNLPEIDNFYVKDKTLKELKRELNLIYQDYIIDPNINISITSFRPVNIYISGEVNTPGLYQIPYEFNNLITNSASNVNKRIKTPKLFDALKLVNGITNYADVTNLEIIRINSKEQGGGKIITKINLLDLIINGNQLMNVKLHDGDFIRVNRASKVIKEQILAINKTNLTPNEVTVFLTGNVVNSGKIVLNKGASLVQAIASGGGKKMMTGNIEFIRFNSDGSFVKKKFAYNKNAKVNTFKNPILMNGDIINVNKSILGKTAEILDNFSSPIITGYGLYNILD